MLALLISNTVIFLLLGLIWSKEGIYNLIAKVSLFGLGMLNLIYLLKELGYLIKIN
jgi:hypothetical protein